MIQITNLHGWFVAAAGVVLLASSGAYADTIVLLGNVDNFDGPNDLLLTDPSGKRQVVYAVDAGTAPIQSIGGVPFLTTNDGVGSGVPGMTIAGPGAPFGWTSYAFTDGSAGDNAALNEIMREIQCCSGGGTPHTYSFALNPGLYEVQVLWGENGGNATSRNWDIEVEGVLAVDTVFSNGLEVGGVAPNLGGGFGTRWTYTLPVLDGSLDIRLGQIGGQPFAGGDANYVVSAFIIRQLIPEPSTITLGALGLLGLVYRARRRRHKLA